MWWSRRTGTKGSGKLPRALHWWEGKELCAWENAVLQGREVSSHYKGPDLSGVCFRSKHTMPMHIHLYTHAHCTDLCLIHAYAYSFMQAHVCKCMSVFALNNKYISFCCREATSFVEMAVLVRVSMARNSTTRKRRLSWSMILLVTQTQNILVFSYTLPIHAHTGMYVHTCLFIVCTYVTSIVHSSTFALICTTSNSTSEVNTLSFFFFTALNLA